MRIYYYGFEYLINIAVLYESQMSEYSNIIFLILFALFLFSAVIQLFYYLFFYLRTYTFKQSQQAQVRHPISVVVCARNEEENLRNFLPSILEQDYPDFEVIVVNDCSDDRSYDVLGELLKIYPNLRVSNVNKDPKFTHNKKFAQFIGIKAAKNEILLFTDADCQPDSDKWLEMMASHFDDKTTFVLGYGGYLNERGLLNKYIRYDTMTIAMQYLGMAARGLPYMGVGRNLAYRRSAFFANKGFGNFNHIVSGDDDLFVNSNASATNTHIEFSTGSHTRSVPCYNFPEWIKQKKRHLTTAPYYKLRDKLLLVIEPLTRILFYLSFVLLVSFKFLWPYVIAVFVTRLVIQIMVLALVQKKLNERSLLKYSIFFDIFSPVINSLVLLSSKRKRSSKNIWK